MKLTNLVAIRLHPTPHPYLGHAPSSQDSHQASFQSRSDNPLDKGGGSGDSNRDYEVNSSMDLDVDDEAHQKMKWRRQYQTKNYQIMNTLWTILIIVAIVFVVLLFACALAGANGRYPEEENL